ncbi:NYN domain-containing protein [Acetonema longum]|uniref:NYN domain-containing protein n=1 Tax=Acetonema longum DSM 6540 TaxID=1009370 RepID=F7NMY5_9FIRM|nr:NYN domain-containing protein [Acetonema longum]EGO62596.1 hypothetical protein ALO_17341 [Acetonema longum DSM 6540]
MKNGSDRDVLIVDGYNVIHAWPELAGMLENLDHARDCLVDILAEYGAFKGWRVLVVFDAHSAVSPTTSSKTETIAGVEVAYTAEGETADSYIEKLVYQWVRQEKSVYVVTSDWIEQMVILGSGGYRISARELAVDVKQVKRQLKERKEQADRTGGRHEIGSRVNADVFAKLNRLRHGAGVPQE